MSKKRGFTISWVQVLGTAFLVGAVTVLFPDMELWRRALGTGLLMAAIGLVAEDWIET